MQIKSADNRILQEQLQNKVGFTKINTLGFISIYFLQECIIFYFVFIIIDLFFLVSNLFDCYIIVLCTRKIVILLKIAVCREHGITRENYSSGAAACISHL